MEVLQMEKKVISLYIYSKGTFYCFKPCKLPKGNELEPHTKIGALYVEINDQAKGSGMDGEKYYHGTVLQSHLPIKTSLGKFSWLETTLAKLQKRLKFWASEDKNQTSTTFRRTLFSPTHT